MKRGELVIRIPVPPPHAPSGPLTPELIKPESFYFPRTLALREAGSSVRTRCVKGQTRLRGGRSRGLRVPWCPRSLCWGLGVRKEHLRQGPCHETPPGLGVGRGWRVSVGVFARGSVAESKGCPSRLGLGTAEIRHSLCSREGVSRAHRGTRVLCAQRLFIRAHKDLRHQ